ncbi:cytochrome b [Glaciimonas sp. PCH181]|uniref:cytochrome b n=1 Tax=Glaciimonas sp. PCH181 TaxID=2133943 RepID=UPI000D3C29CF|nr:cytochrome b [Glaciimonas sp. PCH181]PUA20039.1 cytochrome B [Glaciimonas sp. PCH181]
MQTAAFPPQRFSRPAQFLHWAIFLLVALAYLAIEVRGPKGSASRIFWSATHYWAGISVLALSVIRLCWRFYQPPPAPEPDTAILLFLAKVTHLMLYIFIIAQPILGILTINFGGHPVTLAGLGSFTIVSPNHDLRDTVKWLHETLGNAFYFVIGLHALAALWHHFVKRDNTLRRML